VTVVVDQLESAKLVVRKPHPTDRRATLVEITPKGRSLALEAGRVLAAERFGLPELLSARSNACQKIA
jgi:DNA-binding MarR family transcriptional regulator